jgi:hypothetical protein
MEGILQGSTSYGQKRATLELAKTISLRLPEGVSTINSSTRQEEIDQLIESSRRILDLDEGWDGEGASPIAKSTWQRAAEFLRRNTSSMRGLRIKKLSLAPLSDGSIDLHWKLPHRELLINISPTDDKWATYYGDNRLGWNTVQGKLNIEAPNYWLFVWLTE